LKTHLTDRADRHADPNLIPDTDLICQDITRDGVGRPKVSGMKEDLFVSGLSRDPTEENRRIVLGSALLDKDGTIHLELTPF